MVSLPDAGDVTLTLPSESGTLALESDVPPAPGGLVTVAYGTVTRLAFIQNSFGVRSIFSGSNGSTVLLLEKSLSNIQPVIQATLIGPILSGTNASGIGFTVDSTDSIAFNVVDPKGSTPTVAASFSFVIYDVAPSSFITDSMPFLEEPPEGYIPPEATKD